MSVTIKTNRTEAYQFTVTDRNDPAVAALRAGVSLKNKHNTSFDRPLYVKLQARGHRRGIRRYNQSLPLDFGTSFDVYIYER